MSNSSLVEYEFHTKKYGKRTGKILKLTPHHAAKVGSAEQIAKYLRDVDRLVSVNYVIGNRGDIALLVPEEYRSWASRNRANDDVAVTIEISNCKASGDYPISEDAYDAFIRLAADICQRNGISTVYYDGTPQGVLTEHRMFVPTQCPGEYLHKLLKSGKVAKDINDKINTGIAYGNGYMAYGLDFEPVFNPDYYLKRYPDLASAGLHSAEQLFQHFCQCGMDEARQASVNFDPVAYRKKNPDLQNAFDDDWEAYYKHYLICGRAEIEEGKRGGFM